MLHEPGVGGLVGAGEGGAARGAEAAPPLLVELHAGQAVRAARRAEPAVHGHTAAARRRRHRVQGWKIVISEPFELLRSINIAIFIEV